MYNHVRRMYTLCANVLAASDALYLARRSTKRPPADGSFAPLALNLTIVVDSFYRSSQALYSVNATMSPFKKVRELSKNLIARFRKPTTNRPMRNSDGGSAEVSLGPSAGAMDAGSFAGLQDSNPHPRDSGADLRISPSPMPVATETTADTRDASYGTSDVEYVTSPQAQLVENDDTLTLTNNTSVQEVKDNSMANESSVGSTSKPEMISTAHMKRGIKILHGISESVSAFGGPLKAICAIANELVELAETASSNRDDIANIVRKIGKHINIIAKILDGKKLTAESERYMNEVKDELLNIKTKLKNLQSYNLVSEKYHADFIKNTIAECNREVKDLFNETLLTMIGELLTSEASNSVLSYALILPPLLTIYGREQEIQYMVAKLTCFDFSYTYSNY
ncbi:hypothetical protein AX16_001996, partial [Volvariella volvacea WC 439]